MVIDEEINRIVKELDVSSLMEKVINSNLYNLLKNDREVVEISNMLKEDINKELINIINSEFNNINDNINNNMSESEREKYINDIAQKYGVTYEQAKGIVGEVQTDTLNQVKKNINDANISEKIINALNNKDYLSNLVNNYINILNNKLSESLSKDTTINEYSKELKDKILYALNKDLENEQIYLNKDVKDYISGLVNKIIDNTANDLSSKYTEEYTNKVVRNVINNAFSEENVDSKLRELLNIYEDDINKNVTVLDDTINTLSESLNKLNDGSKQISTGMNALSNGLDTYNKEGINKINNLVNGNVKTLQKRVDALIKLSDENRILDNTPDKSKSNSTIIFMIDSISKPNEVKVQTPNKKEKESFTGKVKGLFK
jgi:X-X-X-Leu-X-X-Gly heptad repeat protein